MLVLLSCGVMLTKSETAAYSLLCPEIPVTGAMILKVILLLENIKLHACRIILLADMLN